MGAYCPSTNSNVTDANEDVFFSPDGIHWDAHRIGWAVAGGCAALTTLITLFNLTMHAVRYQHPPAQKQVMRVLLMPAVYSIVSFFSYRYYREYEYYILAETAYEAITLSAFLMLLMELVSMNTTDQQLKTALAEKDKKKFPFPFNFWRFRASKPYFWHALSFSVMQYVILRPLISIVGIICLYYGVLCPGEYSIHFAEVYLEAVDFVSISVALYGLIVFYVLCKDELKGRKPLNKFLAIKLIVFFTFYQSFVFSILQTHGVIHGTILWTATNVSDGLSALCTCVEMVFFSIYMGWAYNWTDYTDPLKNPHQRKTSIKTYFQAIWDTINLADFGLEIYLACKFFVDYMRGKPGTHSSSTKLQRTFMPDSIGNGDGPQELSNLKTGYANNSSPNGFSVHDPRQQQDNFTSPPQPVRSGSGGLKSANSYLRLYENTTNGRMQQVGGQAQGQTEMTSNPTHSSPASQMYHTPGGNTISPQTASSRYVTPQEEHFPSPHPTGALPSAYSNQPHSAQAVSPSWNAQQGEATHTQWPEARPTPTPGEMGQIQSQSRDQSQRQRQAGWDSYAESQRSRGYGGYGSDVSGVNGEVGQVREGERGIPGNPRLY
ncbi:uncharacterized protein I303_103234 [Kwoniella dejecticola CBS 10117]|uniref:DUF300-domain-containing protein n=1 Tax=Kwoniella dejecticola CBS 10117 TaxID=1296121 RepID=A0A1A6AAZ5_9TREE|nr:uncharacterized protein I303_03257 [Kwoniella dejecticola CBS 10117]OBR87232.1 hypothetical protein I303_03257 [Kwoniella dejecticola CBS 10117]